MDLGSMQCFLDRSAALTWCSGETSSFKLGPGFTLGLQQGVRFQWPKVVIGGSRLPEHLQLPLPVTPAERAQRVTNTGGCSSTRNLTMASCKGQRVAVIGSGITGLSTAWLLHR